MRPNYLIADYKNEEHGKAIVELLDAYANDPMGGAEPLAQATKANLVAALAEVPGAFTVLAKQGEKYLGLANCFTGFSTFACKPLINIHDIAVVASARGQGIGTGLMASVEAEAHRLGCCKITLEVLQGNTRARAAYERFGFSAFTLDDKTDGALFLQKKL